jgi:tyrosyl-tRNA synthetase
VKFELGVELVDRFHGAGAGNQARDAFIARFREGQVPENIAEITLPASALGLKLTAILKEVHLAAGTSAAARLIEQGGVKVDGEKVSDRDLVIKPSRTFLLQVGKRGFARVTLLNDE